MNKFKVGESVCYKDISGLQLGVIMAIDDSKDGIFYYLWAKSGETGSLKLPEQDLLKIQNADRFLLLAKEEDYGYDLQPCRRLAYEILSTLDALAEEHTGTALFDNYVDQDENGDGVFPGLLPGLDYYEVEDRITDLLQEYEDTDGEPVEKEGE
jgi:hypothetical protein